MFATKLEFRASADNVAIAEQLSLLSVSATVQHRLSVSSPYLYRLNVVLKDLIGDRSERTTLRRIIVEQSRERRENVAQGIASVIGRSSCWNGCCRGSKGCKYETPHIDCRSCKDRTLCR